MKKNRISRIAAARRQDRQDIIEKKHNIFLIHDTIKNKFSEKDIERTIQTVREARNISTEWSTQEEIKQAEILIDILREFTQIAQETGAVAEVALKEISELENQIEKCK